MSDDLIERLRGLTKGYELEGSWRAIPAEAASRIEALQERVEELEQMVATLTAAMRSNGGAAKAREKVLREALENALQGWSEASSYKGDYLQKKHGDIEEIASLRAILKGQP